VATGGKDGTAGAGAHPQAEAMGLGPATVVRLEGALAHEVLRYCTAIRAVCAEGGAGQRMRQVRCSTSRSESMIGRNRRPAATNNSVRVPRAGENGRQHRPRSRYGSGYGTVKLGRSAISRATCENVPSWTGAATLSERHAVQQMTFWESPLDS
jgi:hypothetical protein